MQNILNQIFGNDDPLSVMVCLRLVFGICTDCHSLFNVPSGRICSLIIALYNMGIKINISNCVSKRIFSICASAIVLKLLCKF